jgi:hypothetical protein
MASYGTEAGVAALTTRYTNSGVFDTTTRPTLTRVTTWLAQVSSMINTVLASSGFATPITDADITPALDSFTETMVADLVNAANASGRFYTDRALESGVNPIKAINNDIKDWVETMAGGLSQMGASRSYQAVTVSCTVSNPQFLRTVVEDNSAASTETDWSAVI